MNSVSWLLAVKIQVQNLLWKINVYSQMIYLVFFSVLGKSVVEMQTFEKYFMIWDVIAIQNIAGWVVITFELLLNS